MHWDVFYTKKKSILEDLTLCLGKFFPWKICTNFNFNLAHHDNQSWNCLIHHAKLDKYQGGWVGGMQCKLNEVYKLYGNIWEIGSSYSSVGSIYRVRLSPGADTGFKCGWGQDFFGTKKSIIRNNIFWA